jgi:hypothetical protein
MLTPANGPLKPGRSSLVGQQGPDYMSHDCSKPVLVLPDPFQPTSAEMLFSTPWGLSLAPTRIGLLHPSSGEIAGPDYTRQRRQTTIFDWCLLCIE